MPDQMFSQLTPVTVITGAESSIPLLQGGLNRGATVVQLSEGIASGLTNAVNDAAAAIAGVAVGAMYRNGSVVMVRVA